MTEYKILLGYISIALAVIGYGVYFKQIFSGKIKPHAFSWFLWFLTTGTIFFAQIAKGAGAGAWATGAISVTCFVIFILALFKGERNFVWQDWVYLIAALISLLLWRLTKDPGLAIILLTITDVLATFPTLRKAYHKPFEESFTLFSINALRSVISLFAFQLYTFAAVLYPAKLMLFNCLVALVIAYRRRKIPVETLV